MASRHHDIVYILLLHSLVASLACDVFIWGYDSRTDVSKPAANAVENGLHVDAIIQASRVLSSPEDHRAHVVVYGRGNSGDFRTVWRLSNRLAVSPVALSRML